MLETSSIFVIWPEWSIKHQLFYLNLFLPWNKVGCVAIVTSLNTAAASYNGPEHRQRPAFSLRSLWTKTPAQFQTQQQTEQQHAPPHKRQAFSHQQQATPPRPQPLNIPLLGFRRRQPVQRSSPQAPTPFPFAHTFINKQQQRNQQQGNQNGRPRAQQQQQRRQFRPAPPSPAPTPELRWPRPSPTPATPTQSQGPFKRFTQGQGQRRPPQQQAIKRQSNGQETFNDGFLGDFTRHFSKLPGSFESNFGLGQPASFLGDNDDGEEQRPQAEDDVGIEDGPVLDYDGPGSNNNAAPGGSPASSYDYDEPEPVENSEERPSQGFRYFLVEMCTWFTYSSVTSLGICLEFIKGFSLYDSESFCYCNFTFVTIALLLTFWIIL